MPHEDKHASKHEYGGEDELDPTNIGEFGVAELDSGGQVASDPKDHATSHDDGGSDEIDAGGLSGELADPQKQKALAFGGDPLSTQSTSYVTFYHFIFPGTTKMGTPSAIKVLLSKVGNPTVDVRIHDITNSNTICSVSEQSPSTYPNIDIKDMGTLSNLPTGEAIFLVEALRNFGGGPSAAVVLSGGEVQW